MKWPTIPDIGLDVQSHIEPLRALKQLLEMITGQRGGAPAPVPCVYRERIAPGASNSTIPIAQLKDGDFWINMTSSAKLNYWDGSLKTWLPTT